VFPGPYGAVVLNPGVAEPTLHLYRLGRQPYVPVWRAMQMQLKERGPETPDALWRVEHPPVLTLGRNARLEHLLTPGAVPVIRVDRGGQVTFHGPGQVVVYVLLELRRHRLGVRAVVNLLQDAVIATLRDFGIEANPRVDAPGVYVAGAKIAALGLRVRGGCSMHGVALNVHPRLSEFDRIHPCGYRDLATTSMRALGVQAALDRVAEKLEGHLAKRLECGRQLQHGLPAQLLRALAHPS
jgi:lipoyl(octanoyl) transferase